MFLCLISYRLSKSSNLVVNLGQKSIYRGFSKQILADWSGAVADEKNLDHKKSSLS